MYFSIFVIYESRSNVDRIKRRLHRLYT